MTQVTRRPCPPRTRQGPQPSTLVNHVRNRGIRRPPAGAGRRGRGAAADGVPGLRLGRGRDPRRRRRHWPSSARPGRLANLEAELDEVGSDALHRDHRHGPHPLGDARRADRPQRAPAPRRDGHGRRRAQRHHRELRRRCAPSSRPTASSSPATPTPRSPCTSSPAPTPTGDTAGDFVASAQHGAAPPRGRVHAGRSRTPTTRTRSSRRAGRPRWSSASARARCSSPPTSPRSSSTPATPSSSARTRSW